MNLEDRLEAASNRLLAETHGRIEAAHKALSATGTERCIDCGDVISHARRSAAPFARRCTGCQCAIEREHTCR